MKWYENQDWMQWIAIGASVFIGMVGIFQERVRRWFFRPRLDFLFFPEPPGADKTCGGAPDQRVDLFRYRFFVRNSGNAEMEDVEVMIRDVSKKGADGEYVKMERLSPQNLRWSYTGEVTKSKIQPELFKYCDFGHVIRHEDFPKVYGFMPREQFASVEESEILFVLDTEAEPEAGGYILNPGEFRINLMVAADNMKAETKVVEIGIGDRWSDDGAVTVKRLSS